MQEYGITQDEKLLIAQCICAPLFKKILGDLQRNVEEDSTRLDSRQDTSSDIFKNNDIITTVTLHHIMIF